MDAIHINQVGILLCDQQKLAEGVNQDLGGIGMGSAQRSGGPSDRMEPPLVINMEASHVGRPLAPVGCIEDIKQASPVAQADGTGPAGGEDVHPAETPLLDVNHGNL